LGTSSYKLELLSVHHSNTNLEKGRPFIMRGNPASLFLAGFPRPVERVGNSLFVFSTLSTARNLACTERSDAEGTSVVASVLLGSFFRPWPTSEVFSQKSCARIA